MITPGVEDLDRDPDQAHEQEQVGDRRVDQELEQLVLERHLALVDRQPLGLERLRLRPGDLEPVELCHQVALVAGDEVDRVRVQRLGRR